MKKILVFLMIVVIALVGCNKKEETEIIENNTNTEIEEIFTVESNEKNMAEDKTYFYLIDNEVFFTMKNGKISDAENSIISLSDVFNSDAIITFNDIFSGNAREKRNQLNVAKYYNDKLDKYVHNEESYNLIVSSIDSGDLISSEIALPDNWFEKFDVNSYKLPAKVIQNDQENVKSLFQVYGGTIRCEYGFTTNDDEMLFAEVETWDTLSQKAIDYVTTYILDNELKAAAYKIKCYSLDLDNDFSKENVYLVESEILKTDNGYFGDTDEFGRNNMISLAFIEDEGNIYSIYSGHTPLYSSQKSEFWENLGDYIEETKLAFADFDRDGIYEILFAGEEIAMEPFNVYQLYKYNDGKVELLAELNGPNE